MTVLNGTDVEGLKDYVDGVATDPSKADRDLLVTAHWEGESRARVEKEGSKALYIGGGDELSAMAGILGMLAACDVEVVATHATLLGLELKDLRVEARGQFNLATLLGVDAPHDAGYQQIAYTVVIDAPNATDEQIAYLKERCERSSPVGDTLRKQVPLTLEFVNEAGGS
ncbi:MAG: OsmC family protein [Actinomycetota bacterium]